MPYTYSLLPYYASYLLCIAVHLATLQLVVLVAQYPKWSSQSDRLNLTVLISDALRLFCPDYCIWD
ncbi:hypothetical protein [Nostoc sp.]|uniref:hypothetical protein n=1 Tax=Nostoc sp. TaxID=1180 RepID=UPI002FF7EAA6